MRYIGIDPGVTGGIAVIEKGYVATFPMPTYKHVGANRTTTKVDAAKLAALLRSVSSGSDVTVVVETVHAMPNQGVTSSFNFGRTFGLIEGVVTALGYTLAYVTPQGWKANYPSLKGLEKAEQKTEARRLASSLFPSIAENFTLVKNDGVAEALLIANVAAKGKASGIVE